MRRLAALALSLALLCACRPGGRERSGLSLYFLSGEDYGPAIVSEPYTGPDSPGVERLLSALLSGPGDGGLRSPFPADLLLRDWALEDGVLRLDFSEQYGGLADVSLTLADYCVVLTMCQLEGVEAVEITAAGRPLSYRSHQLLTREEAVLAAAGGENHE